MSPLNYEESERSAALKLIEMAEVDIANGEVFSVEETFREIRTRLTTARKAVSKNVPDLSANRK